MKKKCNMLVLLVLVIAMTCVHFPASAATNASEPIESAFTDPLFLREVRKLVGKTNGEHIYRSDVETITILDVSDLPDAIEKDKYLESLQGIEYFTGLKELNCCFNDIQELDLSHNTKLEVLDCSYNDLLVSLNVSNCPALRRLDCNITGLQSLDISQNTNLRVLLAFYTKLTALDVSHNPLLEKLDVWGGHLVTLDVSNNRKLTYLDCTNHDMCTVESIIGLENCTELKEENFWFEPQNTVRTGHDWEGGTVTVEPNCTGKGERTYTCSNCKMTRTEGIAAAGHQWDAWVVTAKPSLKATGTAEHNCTKDRSHKESVRLPVLTDTTVWTKGEIINGAQEYHSMYGTVTVAVNSPSPAPGETKPPVCPQDSTCQIAKFSDTNVRGWYHNAVHYVLENGLMSGTGKATFAPDRTLSRAMLVQILYNLEGKPAVAGTSGFADVSASAWYADAVAWAAANKVVAGNGDGTFSPESAITREQMATILYQYAKYQQFDLTVTGNLSAFIDGEKVSKYAVIPCNWAIGKGLISGVGNHQLNPSGSAERSHIAAIMKSFCEKVMNNVETKTLFHFDSSTVTSVTLLNGNKLTKVKIVEPKQIKDIVNLLNDFSYVSTQELPPASGWSYRMVLNTDVGETSIYYWSDGVRIYDKSGSSIRYTGEQGYFDSLIKLSDEATDPI